jgi:Astacin (Peptidase family M12A)
MQSATDRDNYVEILFQNIQSGRENAFQSYAASRINPFGYPYDLESVMHYGPYAFSKNGEPTIVSLVSFEKRKRV